MRTITEFSVRTLTIGYLAFVSLGTLAALHAQPNASLPRILSFRIIPTTDEGFGGEWIEFFWRTKGADRVWLYRDGTEIRGRSELPNGEIGFPTTLSGGFKSQHRKLTTYELVAENVHGKASKTLVVPKAGSEPAPPSFHPRIVFFRANPTTVVAGRNVKFFWKVENAKTVHFYENNRELQSPIQLPNGNFGWPFTMHGAFSTSQRNPTNYELVAKDGEGRTARRRLTVGVKPPELQGAFTIRQKNTGRYVDAFQVARQDYRLVTRRFQNNDSQRWILTPLGNNTYTIRQKSTGRYVDAHEVASQDYRLVTRPFQNNDSQRWILNPLGNNTYTIRQKSTGRYVDAHEVASQDYRLVTRPFQNNDSQRWFIQ